MPGELHLRVVTPDRVVIDRRVRSVQFMGIDGSYGILPGHAPLMTAIADAGTMTIEELDGTRQDVFVSDGFAQVQNNVLTLVCEAGELAHEIDFERARQKEEEARKRLAGLDRLSKAFLEAEASLKKALVREKLARRTGGMGDIR